MWRGPWAVLPLTTALLGLHRHLWPQDTRPAAHTAGSVHQARLVPRRPQLGRCPCQNPRPLSAAEATVCTVTLDKTSAGLGFSLEGGKGSLHGDKPLTINRIFRGALCICVRPIASRR